MDSGLSHSICTFRVQGAVNSTTSIHEGEVDRLGRSRREAPRGLDGVDLFEYHDVTTISLNISRVVSHGAFCPFLLFVVL